MHLQQIITGLILLILASQVSAQTTTDTIQDSRALSAKGQHAEAVSLLHRARQLAPDDLALALAHARALAWAGEFEEAQVQLDEALKQDRFNGDALLLQADLQFYQGHMQKAADAYRYLLSLYPDYEEARNGLKRATAAIAPAHQDLPRWSVSSGMEYSWFDQDGRAPWRQVFVQVDRAQGAINHYVKYAYLDQYRLIDSEFEVGGSLETAQGAVYQASISVAPNSEFKARSRLMAGADIPIWKSASGQALMSILGQLKFERYPDRSRATTLLPGLAMHLTPTTRLSTQLINVNKSSEPGAMGRQFRLDQEWSDAVSWHIGYAKAPEVDQGRVIRTQTWFTGGSFNLSDGDGIRLGYAHESREQQYIRHLVYASFTHRF